MFGKRLIFMLFVLVSAQLWAEEPPPEEDPNPCIAELIWGFVLDSEGGIPNDRVSYEYIAVPEPEDGEERFPFDYPINDSCTVDYGLGYAHEVLLEIVEDCEDNEYEVGDTIPIEFGYESEKSFEPSAVLVFQAPEVKEYKCFSAGVPEEIRAPKLPRSLVCTHNVAAACFENVGPVWLGINALDPYGAPIDKQNISGAIAGNFGDAVEVYTWTDSAPAVDLVCPEGCEDSERVVQHLAVAVPSSGYLADVITVHAQSDKEYFNTDENGNPTRHVASASFQGMISCTVVRADATIGYVGEDKEDKRGYLIKGTAESGEQVQEVSLSLEPWPLPADEERARVVSIAGDVYSDAACEQPLASTLIMPDYGAINAYVKIGLGESSSVGFEHLKS